MVRLFVYLQLRIGNGDLPMIKFVRAHESGITYSMWGLMFLGLLIALPVMWTDLFGFRPRTGKPEGVLVANIGMTLDELQQRSTLKFVPSRRIALTGSHQAIAEAVFDFEVAGSDLRFEACRYYWLQTFAQDDPKLEHLSIGISPQKLPLPELRAAERLVQQRLRDDGWQAGRFIYRTSEQQALHSGAKTGGDGRYWAKGETLLILSVNRMDEETRGEPAGAGEFILYIDLVPRNKSSYSELEFAPSAHPADR